MNDVSEMNPVAGGDLPPGRVHGVSFVKRSLHFKCTPDGLECAREFHEKPVAYRLDLFAGVSREEWPEEASMLFEQLECECLVSLRERRIACDVCEHYRGESTLGLWQFVISVISSDKMLCLVTWYSSRGGQAETAARSGHLDLRKWRFSAQADAE